MSGRAAERRRRGAARLGIAVALLGLAGLLTLLLLAGHTTTSRSSTTLPTLGADGAAAAAGTTAARASTRADRPPAVTARGPAPRGGRTELAEAMHHWLGLAGPHAGALLVDLTTPGTLYDRASAVGRPPASVEKLYTTVALLRRLGPRARLRTEVVGTGGLDPHGVWHGDLYLRGGGDPTFGSLAFNRAFTGGDGAPVEALVAAIRRAGIRRVSGHVIADASLFDAGRGGLSSGQRADMSDLGGQLSALTYNHGTALATTPELFAARTFAGLLRRDHIAARPGPASAPAPAAAVPVAAVTSPPLTTLLRLMDVPSDDLYAEMLTKGLGARFAHDGTIAGGAGVIAGAIAELGVHPVIRDGSGLSRADRSSPAQVVSLLRALWGTDDGTVVKASLPVVGETGTVRGMAHATAADGHCVAKTGTLDFVTNLAGYCESRGGHRVAFAVFLDGPPNWVGYGLLGHMVTDMARLDPGLP